ncbi:MAG TPA: YfdX family protein [Desulfomonilaceae bacterium]|nr:YfdX family protein [Desulfomonilaceae bacterium]
MQRFPLILAVILAIVLSLIATGISVYQAGRTVSARVHFTGILPQEKEVIDRTAVDVLRHIVQARAYIHQKTPGKAGYEVAEAVRLIRTIRDNLSSKQVRDRIWIARKHLEFEPVEEVLSDFRGIYSALNDIDTYLPTDKAKRHIDQAREYLERKEKRQAEGELELADKSLVSVELEIPLLSAEENILKAQEYLGSNNNEKADRVLKIAERKTHAISIIAGSPLRAANRSLWLAIKRYSSGEIAEARAYIEQAKASLERAAQMRDAMQSEKKDKLYKDVTELEKKIAKGGKTGETALKTAWGKSQALIEREAEYLAADWAKTEAIQPRENMLIEAKLHVAFAETYQVMAREPANSVKEIALAEAFLDKLLKSNAADNSVKQEIGTVEKELEDIKAKPEKNDSAVSDRYEAIKTELSDLIKRMEDSDMIQKMEGSV